MDRIQTANELMERLYGQAESPSGKADPEFAAIKERLIYGEVYEHVQLDAELRELLILAVAVTNQTHKEVSIHTKAALQAGASPEKVKEAVYHCAPYIGFGKAEASLEAVNRVLEEQSVHLPLSAGSTVTEEDRLEKGIAAQKSIFGDNIDIMRAAAPNDQRHIQDYLSACCFGDFYTREGLDLRQRELLTFCILCTQGGLRKSGAHPCQRKHSRRERQRGSAGCVDHLPSLHWLPPHPERTGLYQRSPQQILSIEKAAERSAAFLLCFYSYNPFCSSQAATSSGILEPPE